MELFLYFYTVTERSLQHPTSIFFIRFAVALLLSAKIKFVLDDLHIWMYVYKTELLTMCFQFSQAGFSPE